MFQGKILSKSPQGYNTKYLQYANAFFLQTDWLLQSTSTNTATSDKTAKYISKPKSQARIYLSNQH